MTGVVEGNRYKHFTLQNSAICLCFETDIFKINTSKENGDDEPTMFGQWEGSGFEFFLLEGGRF